MKLNENIALSKSILNKVGITTQSPEYKDYLKIREICSVNHGYVGILTKIRFQDGVTDMDEIKSIFDILKDSKIDVGKLNKMSYDDILNLFYDEFKTTDADYEIVFKDSEYTYYKINTYKGILKTGSPAWCLKTKSKWDEYQIIYPIQFVVVSNLYKNRLPVPEDDILETYTSKKEWVRFGVSIKKNDDSSASWIACSDNNNVCNLTPASWTFFGVMCTILNLIANNKKSYYDDFYGCKKVESSKTWHKIVDREKAFSRLRMPDDYVIKKEAELYLFLSDTYSKCPLILILDDTQPRIVQPIDTQNEKNISYCNIKIDNYVSISSGVSKKIFDDYAKKSNDPLYLGIKLKLGLTTLEEIKLSDRFIKQVDNWLVFRRNDNYYIVVNSNTDEYHIPHLSFTQGQFDIEEEPVSFYLRKTDLKPISFISKELPIRGYHQKVIDALKDPKNVRGFFDFLKDK